VVFSINDFNDLLKSIKENSFNIHLPNWILQLPKNKLEMFLKGFFMGDGHFSNYEDKRGFNTNKDYVYSTSCESFADNLLLISLQLGKPMHKWKQLNHKGVGDKPIYRLTYNPKSHFIKDYGYKGMSEVSIKSIKLLDFVQTYDWEVKDTHTFFFKNGIMTFNCEDGAILMANIMVESGIPYWRIRLNAGDVKGGGHAYVTYLREKDNKWYILDWCYWSNESINFGRTWAEAKNYFGIWFSWNNKYGFIKDELDR
jgi:hypothetical protein